MNEDDTAGCPPSIIRHKMTGTEIMNCSYALHTKVTNV